MIRETEHSQYNALFIMKDKLKKILFCIANAWFWLEIVFGYLTYYILNAWLDNWVLALSITALAPFVAAVIIALIWGCKEGILNKDRTIKISGLAVIGLCAAGLLALPLLAQVTFTVEESETQVIPYETKFTDNSSMELGQTRTVAEGKNGEKIVTYIVEKQFLGGNILNKEVASETIKTQPITAQVEKGTKRYRYMSCSDKTYYEIPEDTFNSNPNVGYTMTGTDVCKENGHGVRLDVSNTVPQFTTTYDAYTDGGAICADGTRSYSTGRGTCSHHGGVSQWL